MVSPIGNQQATYNYTQRLLKQSNPSFDGYWVNTVNFGPLTAPTLQHASQTTETTAQPSTNSGCTDGKDDGSIGFFSAVGHALKGGVKFFTGMFTDENGDFSLKQTAKTLLIGGAIAAATCIPVVGPLVIPALCTVGMIQGGTKVISGISNAMDAKTDAEAKAAWEQIGNGATEGIVSYTGYKASGGWKANISKAKAQYAEQATKFGKLTRSGQKYYDETAAKLNQKTELSPEQIDKNLGLDENPELKQLNEYYKNLEKQGTDAIESTEPNYVEYKTNTTNELQAQARQNSINEQAARVDRGESTAHTNAEIRETVDNIDTSRLNGNNRAMVDRAAKDVPTEAQQAAYDRQMAYQAADPKDVQAFEAKGGKIVEHEGPNATQNLGEVQANPSNPKTTSMSDIQAQIEKAENAPRTNANGMTDAQIKAQIADTGRIPDGDYLVEMKNGESGIYRVQDGKIDMTKSEKAGTKFTGKNIDQKNAKHISDVEQRIRDGYFVAA